MKMFWIPNPWDYHGSGGFVILARDAESAVKILKADIEKKRKSADGDDYFFERDYGKINYEGVRQVEGRIFVDSGCDC